MSRGRFLINSSALPFTAPSYDLLSTATPLDLPGTHWRRGLVWEPICPESDGTYDECVALEGTSGTPGEKLQTFDWSVRGAIPFTVYTRLDCAPVGMWENFPAYLQTAYLRAEAREVERIFWTGQVTEGGDEIVFPHLTNTVAVADGEDLIQPAMVEVSANVLDVVTAVGLLEQAARDCYPGIPTLHVPIVVAELMARYNLLITRNGLAYTPLGSKVVIGGGYPGTSPLGVSTDDVFWIYATGEVFYQREIAPRSFSRVESFDRSVNTVSMIGERTYVVGWDCCLLGIQVGIVESGGTASGVSGAELMATA